MAPSDIGRTERPNCSGSIGAHRVQVLENEWLSREFWGIILKFSSDTNTRTHTHTKRMVVTSETERNGGAQI